MTTTRGLRSYLGSLLDNWSPKWFEILNHSSPVRLASSPHDFADSPTNIHQHSPALASTSSPIATNTTSSQFSGASTTKFRSTAKSSTDKAWRIAATAALLRLCASVISCACFVGEGFFGMVHGSHDQHFWSSISSDSNSWWAHVVAIGWPLVINSSTTTARNAQRFHPRRLVLSSRPNRIEMTGLMAGPWSKTTGLPDSGGGSRKGVPI